MVLVSKLPQTTPIVLAGCEVEPPAGAGAAWWLLRRSNTALPCDPAVHSRCAPRKPENVIRRNSRKVETIQMSIQC